MCSPGDSDQLVKLSDQLDIAGIANPYKKLLPKNSNTDTAKLLDLILELPELEAIRFAGGEPFIMPEVEQFLHRLVAHGRTNVSIEFVTNCTSAKPKLIELLEQFNHVELMCSIDGVGSTLEYQRYPAKWSVIENNFKRMYESKCNTRIVPCIGLLNANDLVNFFAWAEQYERSLITYNEIQEPSFLDFRLVPLEHRVFLKDVSKNSVAPSWDHYIDELQYQVREPTLEESNELKQYASAWDYRSTEKFLDRYPWANYIIEKANI
jgi:organic radical activating enzyme